MISNQKIKKCRKFLNESMEISLAFTGSDSESPPVQEVKQLQQLLSSKMYPNTHGMLMQGLGQMIAPFLEDGAL